MKKPWKRLVNTLRERSDTSNAESPASEKELETEIQYDRDFRRTLIELEHKLHTTEEPTTIMLETLKTTCAFHEADWCGILIADRSAKMWSPAVWFDSVNGAMSPTLFHEIEYFEYFPRWVQALKTGSPVVIQDVSILEDSTPEEIAQYERLEVHSVIGAPFGDRPTGFLVVRNPRKYPCIPDLVQMLAFVSLSSYYLQELQEGMHMMREAPDDSNDNPQATVTINLFGVPEIITPNGQINEVNYHSENGWKLLTYLALHKTPVPSRTIAATLWPNDDEDVKSDNIRRIIYRFKSKLAFLQPNELLSSTPSGYCLNPNLNIKCDVHEFDALCKQAATALDVQTKISLLKKAVALYRGDIYAKFSHEDWLMAVVAHYQMQYLKSSSQLMELLSKLGDYQGVQEIALHSMKVMPGSVNAGYWMIVSLYQLGGRDAAAKVLNSLRPKLTEEEFKELKERLKKELGQML